ncbi:hypothetical protein CRG98_044288, partial [Punica granatum]
AIGNPKGCSPPTDSCLPHAAGRALKAPKVVEGCATPPKPTMFKEGQTMEGHHQLPHVMQSRPNAKQTTSPDALRDPRASVLGLSQFLNSCSGPSRFQIPVRVHPGFKFPFGSIPVSNSCSDSSRFQIPVWVHPGFKFLFGSIPVSFRSILVAFGSIPVSFRSILVSFGSIPVLFRSIPVAFGSIPVHSGLSWSHSGLSRSIQVYPGRIRVYPSPFRSILVSFRSIPVHSSLSRSRSGLSWSHSGLSWSHSGLSRSIQVYPGPFGSIPVLIFDMISRYIQSGYEQPWGNGIRAVAGPKKGVLLMIFGYIL